MKLTTKQIAAFVAVAQQENFTRAAKMLNITQPTLSLLIKDLENALSISLFDRSTRDVSLSKVGNDLLPIAKRVHADVLLILKASADLSQLVRGRVRVACSTVIASTQLPAIIRKFETQHPGVQIEIIDTVEQKLLDLVKLNSIDFAIATAVDPDPLVQQTAIGSDNLVVFVPLTHSLADQEEISWKELEDQPLTLLSKNSPLRKIVDRTAGRMGIWLNIKYEVGFGTTALALADNCQALTILPENIPYSASASNCVKKPLVKPTVSRSIVLLQLSRRNLSPSAAAFFQFCANLANF